MKFNQGLVPEVKVDFTKKVKNTDKFRQAAIKFQQTGRYCDAPYDSSEYYDYWDTQAHRCLYGFTAEDGDYITGFHYFYLNFSPITRIVVEQITLPDGTKKSVRRSGFTFPDFWDYDYYYYNSVEQAIQEQQHLCVLKSRRKGYSYKGGSMACRNYYLIEGSKTYVFASNKQYLTEDGILTKAWEYMSFIDKHTAWGKKRSVDQTLRRRASYFVKDEYGNQIEMGYKSEIMGLSIKDNPGVVRGKRGELILFEEGGSSPELGQAWHVARPSVEQDGINFGIMIVWGTGGDKDSMFRTLKDMFYHPKTYNCLGLENIWDDMPTDKECGFFVPQHANLDVRDDNGDRLYMDADGNTKNREALEYVLEQRREIMDNATNASSIDRYVAERPVTPQEAMLEFGANIFPKKELQVHLANIRTNTSLQNHKQVGDLIQLEGGEIQWIQKKVGDIVEYPLSKDSDPTGSIVIWEHPPHEIPSGLYIAGCDPYDHDKAGTNSLGSTFIYKRFQSFEQYYDIIVAEYTGRPETAEDYYENVRLLLLYYNARLLYENERKGIFPYFTNKNSDYLLADQPDIINDIVGNSKVQRRKGCHLNGQIKDWAEGMLKEWLNEEVAPGVKNLHRILSEPLLEELISYNDSDNFDRVSAMFQVMIYKEELHKVVVRDKSNNVKKQRLFDGPIFTDGWFNKYDSPTTTISNENNTFIF